jgi:Potential Queuosine, Q, salvage protein family
MSLLQQVRTSCKAVAEQAQYVQIDYERIPSYAASLPLAQSAQPEHDPASHYLGHGDDTIAFFVTLDTINFGSGYFPHLHKRPGMSGYFTVASSLNDYYKEHGALSAQQLTQLTLEECTHIFGQDLHIEPVRALMQLFTTALHDLGHYLLDRFDGSFVGLVKAAHSSAERLVELLTKMPYFNDVETYDGRSVHFYKRAQLTAADLAIAFHRQGPGYFADLDQLTIFADNLVPHVLRFDDILHYADSLAARIDSETLIPAGSPEEIEIRASAVHAVELLVAQLRKHGHTVTATSLDYLLWNRGQQPFYKVRPRHRTRTVFY